MDDKPDAYNSNSNTKKFKSFLGIRSDRLIFIICLLIASMFWLLIKLSDIYSVNYSFGLKYNNVPAELRLTDLTDSILDLSLTARGFAILKMNLFNNMDVLDINLANYTIDHKGGNKYSIYTQELIQSLSELVNVDEKDIQFSRAILLFEMEKTGEKLMPIIPNFSIEFAKQYDLLEEVKSEPQEVKVYGPQKLLDTLSFIDTQKLILTEVASDKVIKVALNNPYPNLLTFEDENVDLYFEIEKFTESEIVVPVNLSGLQYNIKTFPSQVLVYFKVAQKDFNEVRPHQFNIIPVVDNLDIVHAKKLPLKIYQHPDFVRNIRIVPSEVEFLIIK